MKPDHALRDEVAYGPARLGQCGGRTGQEDLEEEGVKGLNGWEDVVLLESVGVQGDRARLTLVRESMACSA